MKILQVITSFPPAFAYGGPAKVAYEISRELVKRGHEVTVYTTDVLDKNSRYKFESNPIWLDGIEVYHFKNVSNHFAANYGISCAPEMLFAFKKNLKKFDIIHCHENRAFEAALLHHYAKKYKIPYILQAHGTALPLFQKQKIKHIFDFFFGIQILDDASKLIALTKAEVDQFYKMKVPEDKIVLIPNGINANSFCNLPKKGTFRKKYEISENYIVLFLGRLHERKGIDFLIKSFAELKNELKDVTLVLCGPDNGYKTKAETLVNEFNLTNNVRFIGHVSEFDKLAAYVDANVLVYPSLFEIFGLVPFEAIMCNTPVIVTDDCGCGELIAESKSGFLVEYGNIYSLKEKIKIILENPHISSEFVVNGKKFIYNNLSWEFIVHRLEESYENSINRS